MRVRSFPIALSRLERRGGFRHWLLTTSVVIVVVLQHLLLRCRERRNTKSMNTVAADV